MNSEDWKSQIKRGTLEFCILLMIKQRMSYGHEIISTLEEYPMYGRTSIRCLGGYSKKNISVWLLLGIFLLIRGHNF